MESRRLKSLTMMWFAMGLLLVQSEASFFDCYKSCLMACALEKKLEAVVCPAVCLKQCIHGSSSVSDEEDQTSYFCKLGCATSLCASLASAENPNAEKIDGCLNNCSNMCAKKS